MFQDRNCEMAPLLDDSGYTVPHNSFICQQMSLVVDACRYVVPHILNQCSAPVGAADSAVQIPTVALHFSSAH